MQVFGQFEQRDWRKILAAVLLALIVLIGVMRGLKSQGGQTYTVKRPVTLVQPSATAGEGKLTPYPSAVVTVPAHPRKH